MGFSEWDTCPKYKLLCLGNNLKKPDTFLFFSNLIAKTWYFLKLPDKKKPDTFWNFSKKPDTLENVQISKPDKKKTYEKNYFIDGLWIHAAVNYFMTNQIELSLQS